MFDKIKNSANKAKEKMREAVDGVDSDFIDRAKARVSESYEESSSFLKEKADQFSDSYIDSGLDGIKSFCSWCFEEHEAELKEKSSFSRNIYACKGCGKEIVKCRACVNKAKYSSSSEVEESVNLWSGNFCAVHEGTIASFERLNWQLKSIAEYGIIVDREERNYKKIATTAAYTVGGAAMIAPVALAAAPAVGGAIGTSILGYSGAAATNAGLATLGGGAVAAGGAGMAGGVAVVTAAGSALGGRYGAVVSNSYFGDIDGFEIIRIKPGKSPAIVCIDGFMTQGSKETRKVWLEKIEKLYPENEVYHVGWESKRLKDIAKTGAGLASKEGAKSTLVGFAASASKKAATKIAPLGIAFQALGLLDHPWAIAGIKAYQTGALLADMMARTEEEYVLIGHSLGARVIYSCLSTLKTKDRKFVKEVHLLGGAVNNTVSGEGEAEKKVNWSGIDGAVEGPIYNYYSDKDDVLRYLYTVGEAVKFESGSPIGRNPINVDCVVNIDVSDIVSGHTAYKPNLTDVINRSQ